MANTFLAARGVDVGKSLCEHDLRPRPMRSSTPPRPQAARCTCRTTSWWRRSSPPIRRALRTCNVHEVAADEMILDVGPQAVEALADVLKTCRTLVWNGPLGAFETPPFDAATVALARTAAALTRRARWSRSPAAATPWRRSTSPAWRTISRTSRPPAARSSNGWKAASCRAWRRCGPA
jgi:3-phosphoglycerate kinase